jgi:hypothetical protein
LSNNSTSGIIIGEFDCKFEEGKLAELEEAEIMASVESSPLFDHLHNEKIPPIFLSLAKKSVTGARLSDITNNNGAAFENKMEREDFIVNLISSNFAKPANVGPKNRADIENFLGDEVINNPVVSGCKLTLEEAAELDNEINILELDKAKDQSNTRMAGGLDGVGNAFLKKFWSLLRQPLFNYTKNVLRKGVLTDSFRTAAIRLIPKKGNNVFLKNWRPISLLSCSYKIILRALNNRLKKVTSRIFSRAQKGFVKERQIQEVLINTVENISFFRNFNLDKAVVTIEFAKAFDSVDHSFLISTLEFFGFGPYLINMVRTLCTNRKACILLDDSNPSRVFNLETGVAQGDCPSPILYNLVDQILIFKLEFIYLFIFFSLTH